MEEYKLGMTIDCAHRDNLVFSLKKFSKDEDFTSYSSYTQEIIEKLKRIDPSRSSKYAANNAYDFFNQRANWFNSLVTLDKKTKITLTNTAKESLDQINAFIDQNYDLSKSKKS